MYHIGLDAGGTKTHVAIMNSENKIIFETKTGPGNIAVHYENAKKHIVSAITTCLDSEYGKHCTFIVLGIAGIEKGDMKQKLQQEFEQLFDLPTLVMNDAELAYYATFGYDSGILTIAGTGSVFIGKNKQDTKMIGGWGHLLGDEGSSYHIGISALKLLAEEIDQGKIQTNFASSIATAYKLYNASKIKEFVYSSSKTDIAAIAYFVDTLARSKDEHAVNILQKAGKEIARKVDQLISALQLKSPLHVGCRGSLLEKNKLIQQSFVQSLKERSHQATLIFKPDPVVLGANAAWYSRKEFI